MIDVSLFRPRLRGRCHAEAGAERAGLPGGRLGTYGPAMSLTPEEIERYARHLVLADIGGPGQAKLKAARVLVVDDVVSLSNLQRQVIHASLDVGRPKVASAEAAIRRLNPHVAVNVHSTRLTAENARGLVAGYDVVADGSDNFDTRYAVSDACFFERRPLVTAALGQFDGSLTTIRAHETG